MSDKTLSRKDAIDSVWKLADSIDFCFLITWDGERQRARPLSARPDRDENRIYFLIGVEGEKDDQIAKFPTVSLAFADVRSHDYLALTGQAEVTNDREKIRELWSGADRAFWDDADDPSIRLLSVTPEDAELWLGPNRLIAGAKMLGAALTGAKADFGENVKVDHL
ncbi:MAG: pyridoxamine 5'-phosphate oxidase family protein [Amaricoccus sp.]|uniref:pyridoxamine 5'-phosphate oxidase family protein n=1 Tax=Amaricoccus sp. TaxID=1872485 RepID=UPI0039E241AA